MLDIKVVPEGPRVVVRAEGEVQGDTYVTSLMAVLERDPDLLRWDFLYDLTRYEGGVTHDDLAELARRLAARFGEIDAGGAVTVIVSPDQGYRFWLPLINAQFPHRRFVWTQTMAAAEAELAAAALARGEVSPGDPGRSC